MTRGKQTCKILKEIRRQIAEVNDIHFVTSECRHKGDCLGTCPKCEAETLYLERQLQMRQLAGKAVVIAGISAGMIALSGCGNASNSSSDNENGPTTSQSTEIIDDTEDSSYRFEGELPCEDEYKGHIEFPDDAPDIVDELRAYGEVPDEDLSGDY